MDGACFISGCTVYPAQPSKLGKLKLSVADLSMLSCHYIQKGLLFPRPPIATHHLAALLRLSLSHALTHFPALAGTFVTDSGTDTIFISCDDAGVPFTHYRTTTNNNDLSLRQIVFSDTLTGDVPEPIKRDFFELTGAVSYDGHFRPLGAFRMMELHSDGSIFIGCSVNHAIVDGTSFWNFFNSWAELCRTGDTHNISNKPDFRRNYFGSSTAAIKFPGGKGPDVTFPADAPLRERILHFSADAIRALKSKANNNDNVDQSRRLVLAKRSINMEIMGKQIHDMAVNNPKKSSTATGEISSFQSLCALLWKHVTRARDLQPGATTTFRMAVNCRHRIEPKLDAFYFGNAIQSIPTTASASDIATKDVKFAARMLRESVVARVDGEVRRVVEEWERSPRCFPLGNPDGTGLTMGSSPRFPMYENNFGWGRPVAVRSGRANKFDGKVSAFPGREGDGGVDLEVCLKPETMEMLIADEEFMQYVTVG